MGSLERADVVVVYWGVGISGLTKRCSGNLRECGTS